MNDVGLMFAEETTARIGAMIEGGAGFDCRSAEAVVSQHFLSHSVEKGDLIECSRTADKTALALHNYTVERCENSATRLVVDPASTWGTPTYCTG